MHYPTDRITHTTAFVTPVVEHWLEREIAQWVHPMKDRSDDPPHHERTLYLWATSRSRHHDQTCLNLTKFITILFDHLSIPEGHLLKHPLYSLRAERRRKLLCQNMTTTKKKPTSTTNKGRRIRRHSDRPLYLRDV